MSIFHKNHKRGQKANTSKRQTYLLSEKSPFNLTEAFRNLKMSLSVSIPKQRDGIGSSFLCCSSFPMEGKTMTAANIALMFAQSNVKVVLADTDLRAGRIGNYFKMCHTPGLSDYLSGQATLDEILRPCKYSPNLYIVTRGTQTARPYELLSDDVMKKFNDELKARFSYVFYDSSPLRVVPDALAVAPIADGTFLVVRHQFSYQSDVRQANESLKFVKASVLGIVVNDYKPEKYKKKNSRSAYYSYESYYSEQDFEPESATENAPENASEGSNK